MTIPDWGFSVCLGTRLSIQVLTPCISTNGVSHGFSNSNMTVSSASDLLQPLTNTTMSSPTNSGLKGFLLWIMDVVAYLEKIRKACPNVERIYFCILDNHTTPPTKQHNRKLQACILDYWAVGYGRPVSWAPDAEKREGMKLLRFTDQVVQAKEKENWKKTVRVALFDEMREERGISDKQILPHGPYNF